MSGFVCHHIHDICDVDTVFLYCCSVLLVAPGTTFVVVCTGITKLIAEMSHSFNLFKAHPLTCKQQDTPLVSRSFRFRTLETPLLNMLKSVKYCQTM